MAKMKAAMAAVLVMEKEGVTQAFGVPGAAINPLYAQLKERGTIGHVLARHVEGASHMAEGYTRACAGNIGVCIGTSGPAGTDMITGLYSASADSIPILCITGQAPRARLHKEDFQAVDIASIAKPVTKMATTVLEPAQVPRVFQQAFHLMRSGRPGPVLIDLPFDVQMAEIEFDIDTYEPMAAYKPAATRKQVEKALAMLNQSAKPLIVADGGSTDGSLALPFLQENGVRGLLVKTAAGKLSAQLRCVYSFALEQGYDGIVSIDGNDKDDPEAIPRFIAALDQGVDFVQASRFVAGGVAENTPKSRDFAIRFIHAPMLSLFSGFKWTDTTQGFRAYSRAMLLDPKVAPFRAVFMTYELLAYLSYRVPKLGYRCVELSTIRRYPKGEVPTKISAFKGNLSVLQILFQACLGQFNPQQR